MWLAQGDGEAAAAAIRRLVGETSEPSRRALLLAAQVEITLTVGDVQAARSSCGELRELAERCARGMMGAMVAYGRGAVDLADGDAEAALVALRHAWQSWLELDAPYEAARARVLVGVACRALGDDETAALELDAAREVLARLGAAPDLARVDSLTGRATPPDTYALTPRELQVLRLVASGKSDRQVASTLVVSEHTVARHLQNSFAKLGVSSRTAASAFALSNDLF